MRILSIESSADETATAILSAQRGTFKLEAHAVASQIKLHEQYGGIFPMMAKREHAKNITPLLIATLRQAKLLKKKPQTAAPKLLGKLAKLLEREAELFAAVKDLITTYEKPRIDRIAVTVGPGLTPALWVGINFARALALAWNIEIVPVNHMEGHILSVFPTEKKAGFRIGIVRFPVISLLVSGGHTEIIVVKGIGKYTLAGQTRDDAAGEAFDKVARMLGLPYPGGPQISKLAAMARKQKLPRTVKLPRPMIDSKDFDFSFSGLKTSVLYLLRDLEKAGTPTDDRLRMEIAREFEDAVCDVLIKKTLGAAKMHKAKRVIVGGGVSANKELAKRLTKEAKAHALEVAFPAKNLSTDNAIMIGLAGYFSKKVSVNSKALIAKGNMAL